MTTVVSGLDSPAGIAVDSAGDIYVSVDRGLSGDREVRKIPADGGPQTVVGTGLTFPEGLTIDAAGDVYIADFFAGAVVKVPADGGPQTTTPVPLPGPQSVEVWAPPPTFLGAPRAVAGLVGKSYSYRYAASTPAGEAAARFSVSSGGLPPGVTLDSATGLLSGVPTRVGTYTFVVQTANAATGTVTPAQTVVVADLLTPVPPRAPAPGDVYVAPREVAVDVAGDVYVAGGDRVVRVPAGGGAPTAVGSGLRGPTGLALNAFGAVTVADAGNRRVVTVPATGGVQSIVGTGLRLPAAVAVSAPAPTFRASAPPVTAPVGVPYAYRYTAATPPAEPVARFRVAGGQLPPGLTLDSVTGRLAGTPRRAGVYTFVAETHNVATGTLAAVRSITVAKPSASAAGDLWVADAGGSRVLKVPAGGAAPTAVGTGLSRPLLVAVASSGDVYIVDYTGQDVGDDANRVLMVPPDGGPQRTVDFGAALVKPSGMAVDAAGDVFVNTVRAVLKLPAGGGPAVAIHTGIEVPGGLAADAAGNLYVGDHGGDRVLRIPAGGGAATTVGVGLFAPSGLAVDAAGNVYVAEGVTVVKVPADGGAQTDVGTGLADPFGVAVDRAGNVYIADTENDRVVRVPAGGGPQTVAATGLAFVFGLAVFPPFT